MIIPFCPSLIPLLSSQEKNLNFSRLYVFTYLWMCIYKRCGTRIYLFIHICIYVFRGKYSSNSKNTYKYWKKSKKEVTIPPNATVKEYWSSVFYKHHFRPLAFINTDVNKKDKMWSYSSCYFKFLNVLKLTRHGTRRNWNKAEGITEL